MGGAGLQKDTLLQIIGHDSAHGVQLKFLLFKIVDMLTISKEAEHV